MTAPRPLRSLYGSRERPQEILTPACLLDAIEQVWPEGIALDPCGSLHHTFADRTFLSVPEDGLSQPWRSRTYANPPFKDLKYWLHKAQFESSASAGPEIMVLAPVRTHRAWFWQDGVSAIAWLRPLEFVGFDSSFPAPLCVQYWGHRLNQFTIAMDALSTRVTYASS